MRPRGRAALYFSAAPGEAVTLERSYTFDEVQEVVRPITARAEKAESQRDAALAKLLDAEAEAVRLEALFQATHGVHPSWVAGHERLRAALQEVDRLLAESDDPDPPSRVIHEALRPTAAKPGGSDG